MIIPASRYLWFDALRTFLAFGVAFNHVNLESKNLLVDFNNLLIPARVPCFYFIAGYFLGKALTDIDSRKAFSQIFVRFRRLIVPAVIFLLLVDFSKIYALLNLTFHENFFLHSLFWSTTLVTLVGLGCKIAGIYRYQSSVLLLISVTSMVLLWRYSHLNITVLDFNCTLHSIIFVSAGYCIGNRCLKIPALLKSPWLIGLAILLYFAIVMSDILAYIPEMVAKATYRVILPFLGIYGIAGIFYHLRNYIKHDNLLGHISYYLGQRSLALYVLIWVSIRWFDLHSWIPAYLPPAIQSVVLFIFAITISLLIHDLLCLIPGVEELIFGRKKKLQHPICNFRDKSRAKFTHEL